MPFNVHLCPDWHPKKQAEHSGICSITCSSDFILPFGPNIMTLWATVWRLRSMSRCLNVLSWKKKNRKRASCTPGGNIWHIRIPTAIVGSLVVSELLGLAATLRQPSPDRSPWHSTALGGFTSHLGNIEIYQTQRNMYSTKICLCVRVCERGRLLGVYWDVSTPPCQHYHACATWASMTAVNEGTVSNKSLFDF